MSRSVPEWRGRTDDTRVPDHVRLRVWDRCEGLCHKCGRKIHAGERWTLEHIVALCNGGANAEFNLGLTCCNCLPEKNAADVAEKSAVYEKRIRHLGIRRVSRPMDGSRDSQWKRKMDGTTVRRDA